MSTTDLATLRLYEQDLATMLTALQAVIALSQGHKRRALRELACVNHALQGGLPEHFALLATLIENALTGFQDRRDAETTSNQTSASAH